MQIIGLAIRTRPRSPMQEQESIEVTQAAGLKNDFRGKFTKRQVTLLSNQQWQEACELLGTDLSWTLRRANILVNHIAFNQSYLGKIIQFGQVKLEVMEETEPCERMDAQFTGLTAALLPDWRGGVCCKVIHGGELMIGDKGVIVSD